MGGGPNGGGGGGNQNQMRKTLFAPYLDRRHAERRDASVSCRGAIGPERLQVRRRLGEVSADRVNSRWQDMEAGSPNPEWAAVRTVAVAVGIRGVECVAGDIGVGPVPLVDPQSADDELPGSEQGRNRALEGDVVAVELLEVDDVWGTKKDKEEKKRKKEERRTGSAC
jgi:exoribonuclease R